MSYRRYAWYRYYIIGNDPGSMNYKLCGHIPFYHKHKMYVSRVIIMDLDSINMIMIGTCEYYFGSNY